MTTSVRAGQVRVLSSPVLASRLAVVYCGASTNTENLYSCGSLMASGMRGENDTLTTQSSSGSIHAWVVRPEGLFSNVTRGFGLYLSYSDSRWIGMICVMSM